MKLMNKNDGTELLGLWGLGLPVRPASASRTSVSMIETSILKPKSKNLYKERDVSGGNKKLGKSGCCTGTRSMSSHVSRITGGYSNLSRGQVAVAFASFSRTCSINQEVDVGSISTPHYS